jgi:hypothetical protein
MYFQLTLLKGEASLSHGRLVPSEMRFLGETLNADYKICNIRLREGEYQYNLAKAIALFQLELHFPDVKDIVGRLFGEERTNDIQFIRKIQTILKKMEKSNIVTILPKKRPWDLQRYALLSFKFQDVDKNLVVFATDQQVKEAKNMLYSMSSQKEMSVTGLRNDNIKIGILVLMVIASYIASVWSLVLPIINPIIFISAFSISVTCSIILGKMLSRG